MYDCAILSSHKNNSINNLIKMIQNGLKNFGMKQLAFYFVSSVVNESKGKKYLTKYLIFMASSFL